jgi:hypothetical protein
MLRSIKQLYGDSLGASDGNIGHIKDFYFDDHKWAVRYVVVDTGNWLSERLVLISPHAFRHFDLYDICRGVNLTCLQIENSPPIALHRPVSRQFEEEYYTYYGWPYYWAGNGLWGMSSFPYAEPTPEDELADGAACLPSTKSDDPHLRSTQAVKGYAIETSDGLIGHVVDFIVHDKNWAIRHLVVETGHWCWGKEMIISPKQIDRISYNESKIFVNVTKEAIQKSPQYNVPPWAYQESAKRIPMAPTETRDQLTSKFSHISEDIVF